MDNLYFLAYMFWPYIMAAMILMVIIRFVFLVFFSHTFLNLWHFFLPGYKIFPSRPLYVLHRIVFHACVFISIFFLSFHVDEWEDTLPQWVLYFLPSYVLSDEVLGYTSLFVIVSVIYMFLKRWMLKDMRSNARPFDFILSFVILIPFVTGYYTMTGQETSIEFIDYNLDTIHILSGDIFILVAGFLFCRTLIIKKRCVACLACVNSCPASALVTQDIKGMRHIYYTAENCIHCGSCMTVCEDRASELHHVLGIPWPGRQKELCALEVSACKICNTLFAPQRQLDRLQQKSMDCDLGICPDCKQFSHAKIQQKLLLGEGK